MLNLKRSTFSILGFLFLLIGSLYIINAVTFNISGYVIFDTEERGIDGLLGIFFVFFGLFFLSKTRDRKARGQAALEFLMTYGWAIIAALIIISVILFSEYWQPSTFSPPASYVSYPFGLSAYVLDPVNDLITLEIINSDGEDIVVVTNIVMQLDTGGSCSWSGSREMPLGDQTVYLLLCPGVDIQGGRQFKGDWSIQYNIKESITVLSSVGSITDNIVADNSEEAECVDLDSDTYGLDGTEITNCAGSGVESDCDDDNSAVNPSALEVCDGVDNDCDDEIDEDCGGVPTDYIAYWNFDDNLQDQSGNGNDGTASGDPVYSTDSVIGKSIDLDGNDAVDLGTMNIGDGTLTEMTISLWYEPDGTSGCGPRLISKADGLSENNHYWMFSFCNGELRFRLKTDGTTSTLVGSGGLGSSWTHAVAWYDGINMKIYRDGVDVGTLAKTGSVNINSGVESAIGVNPPMPGTQFFDGKIDEVRIYDRKLSVSEIQALYNEGG